MRWTLTYKPAADDSLMTIWNDGPDRGDITQAANRIDWLLRHDPLKAGEEREHNLRILVEPPLAVYFTVSDADMLVSVVAVWRWTKPREQD